MNINHDEINNRFFTEINGEVAFLAYRKLDDSIEYYRTFVPIPIRNQGIATKIVEFALEYARKNNLNVIPTCSFVKAHLKSEK